MEQLPTSGRYRWGATGLVALDGAPPLMTAQTCSAVTRVPNLRGQVVSRRRVMCKAAQGAEQQTSGQAILTELDGGALKVEHTFDHRWRLKGSQCALRQTFTWHLKPVAAPISVTAAPLSAEAPPPAPTIAEVEKTKRAPSPRKVSQLRPRPISAEALTELTPVTQLSGDDAESGRLATPGDAVELASKVDTEAPEDTDGLLWVFVGLMIAITLMGVYLLWRTVPKKKGHHPLSRDTVDELRAAAVPGGVEPSSSTTGSMMMSDAGLLGAQGLSEATTTAVQATVSPTSTPDQTVCPHCRRRYDNQTSFCPHDGHPLEWVTQADGYDDDEEAEMPQGHQCGLCLQIWPSTLTHCPDDGMRLEVAQSHASDIVARICPQCGARSDESFSFCPLDGAALVNLN